MERIFGLTKHDNQQNNIISYISGGGTATVAALELARKEMFSDASGVRKNVSKVKRRE